MYTTDESTGFASHEYHLYFQSNDAGQSVGSVWGHATSPDMVSWTRRNRTGIKGSSGGGVATPAGFVGADGAPWRAAALASVPVYPPRVPAVGLSVWHSQDDHLASWTVYEGGSCPGTTSNTSGVICPEMVPHAVRAGYIGDNYVWKEETPPNAGNWTYFAVVGTNKCPPAVPWCGYAYADATPQALLFRSPDMSHWTFESVFWDGEGDAHITGGKTHMDTPDTFAVPKSPGLQAVTWLAAGQTVWMTGTRSTNGSTFVPTAHGMLDSGGALVCTQSFTDALQRRVMFGWVKLAVPGQPYTGAQTMPRKIVDLGSTSTGAPARPGFAQGSLGFVPLENVWMLHGAYTALPPRNATAGDTPMVLDAVLATAGISPLHAHLRVDLSLLPPPVGTTGVAATVHVLGGHAKGGVTVAATASPPSPPPPTPAPTPKPPACTAGQVYNSTDNGGSDMKMIAMNASVFGMEGARQCQALCCSTAGCMGWTYTDPQPGTGGLKHDCFLKSTSALKKSSCGDGHCWSGELAATPPPAPPPPPPPSPLLLRVNGGAPLALHAFDAAADDSSRLGVRLDVFVDGAVVEIFANEGEHAITSSADGAANSGVSLEAAGEAKPVACVSGVLMNNSDTAGVAIEGFSPAPMPSTAFGPAAAKHCEQLCCEVAGCTGWTFTDPQVSDPAPFFRRGTRSNSTLTHHHSSPSQPSSTTHDCWLKSGDTKLVPDGCDHYGSGHCWSGLVSGHDYDAAARFAVEAWEMKGAIF